jgi:hypothetical protein
MTIHRPRRQWLTDRDFSNAVGKLFVVMRRVLGSGVEYLLVSEWSHGVRHAHALLILGRHDRDTVKVAVERVGVPLRVTCKPLRKDPGAAVRYIFGDMDGKRVELPPESFRGRIFTYSRRFLVRPWKELWKEFRDREWQQDTPHATHAIGQRRATA